MARTATATGLKITEIHNQKRGAKTTKEEWIRIVNDGPSSWDLPGWIISDETNRQLAPHVYQLPARLGNGQGWTFDPGEVLYLITGHGTDCFIPKPASVRPELQFFWNRDAYSAPRKLDRR